MSITSALSASRGTSNLISRMSTIINRFGLTSSKFAALMEDYSLLALQNGFTATLPITAVILKRHPDLIRRFDQQGIEFAIHGYVHIDYQRLSGKDQIEHFQKAINTFKDCRVSYTGFRAPYLRFNPETSFALNSLKFPYNSSHSLYWNVLNKAQYSEPAWFEYLRVLDFYGSENSLDYLSLPRYCPDKKLIEIPVSLPDDEAMLERLGIKDSAVMAQIWNAMSQEIHRRGELFTLQLHPERVSECGEALKSVILQARKAHPKVWIATLREIADWWQEKQNFSFNIDPQQKEQYRVQASCSDKATILVRHCRVSAETSEWSNDYRIVDARDFNLISSSPPVIGISLNSSPEATRFLQSEGFAYEVSNQASQYPLYFNNLNRFQPSDERRLIEAIEYSDAPLVRFWRWPYQSGSALTVSGDIDSITLFDFFFRLLEARQHRKRQKFQGEVTRAGATI